MGYLKNNVYKNRVGKLDQLKIEIENACAQIPIEYIQNAIDSTIERCSLCGEVNGKHFEILR